MPEQKNNIYIFHGEDDFSFLKKIERWKEEFAKKFGASSVTIIEGETLNSTEISKALVARSAQSLFATKKLLICKECLPTKAGQEDLTEMILSLIDKNDASNLYVFYSSKRLDKRLGGIKKILQSKANINEFELPHGAGLNAWLKAYAKQKGLELNEPALEKLAVYLGRDLYEEKKFGGRIVERKEAFNLWQAASEVEKLAGHGSMASASDVEQLVIPKISENIFDLSDTILDKNKKRALELIENLFTDQSSDEKSVGVKIVSLLAEQFRALLLVSVLKQKRLDNEQIAETLGWSSGRVFMVSKQSSSSNVETLMGMLAQLQTIDLDLKSKDINPKLAINSFVMQFG